MSANGTATATIETLTAEVRVLMVGNRQVTLSVAKQLDWIPLVNLRPFGRVNINGDTDIVIGADPKGVLSLSRVRQSVCREAYIELAPRPSQGNWSKPVRCRYSQRAGGTYGTGKDKVSLSFGKWPILLRVTDMEDRHGDAHICRCNNSMCIASHCGDDCLTWNPRDYRDEIAARVREHRARYDEDQRIVQSAKDLPLIVLAGLR